MHIFGFKPLFFIFQVSAEKPSQSMGFKNLLKSSSCNFKTKEKLPVILVTKETKLLGSKQGNQKVFPDPSPKSLRKVKDDNKESQNSISNNLKDVKRTKAAGKLTKRWTKSFKRENNKLKDTIEDQKKDSGTSESTSAIINLQQRLALVRQFFIFIR